jgi:hypothetical protein
VVLTILFNHVWALLTNGSTADTHPKYVPLSLANGFLSATIAAVLPENIDSTHNFDNFSVYTTR